VGEISFGHCNGQARSVYESRVSESLSEKCPMRPYCWMYYWTILI